MNNGLEDITCSIVGCYGEAFKFVCVSTGWTPRCSSHLPVHCPSCFYVGLDRVWIAPPKSFDTWVKSLKDPRKSELYNAMQMAKMVFGHVPPSSPVVELTLSYAKYSSHINSIIRNPPLYCPCCKNEFYRDEIYREEDRRIPEGAIGYNCLGTPIFPLVEKQMQEERDAEEKVAEGTGVRATATQ